MSVLAEVATTNTYNNSVFIGIGYNAFPLDRPLPLGDRIPFRSLRHRAAPWTR